MDFRATVGPGAASPASRELTEHYLRRIDSLDAEIGAFITVLADYALTQAKQAEKIVADGEADVVLLARELLRDPYFPHRAARELGAAMHVPEQYQRAWG